MADAVAVVIDKGVLGGESAGTFVEIAGQPVCIDKRFQHRRMPILISVRIGSLQRGNKEPREPRRISLLPVSRRSYNYPTFSRQTLNKLTTRARHVENHHPPRRQR